MRAEPGRTGTVLSTVRPIQKYVDLPWSYGETELAVMPVDPFLIYAYWDFSPEDWNKVQRLRKPVVLRIYDVTMIRFDGTNAHSFFDVPVNPGGKNWYVRLWSAEKSLCADLGWLLPNGSFRPIVRSNVIHTPRAGVSIYEESRWIEIRWAGRKASRLTLRKRPGTDSRPPFWRQLEEQATGMTVKTAGNVSSGPIGIKPPQKTPV